MPDCPQTSACAVGWPFDTTCRPSVEAGRPVGARLSPGRASAQASCRRRAPWRCTPAASPRLHSAQRRLRGLPRWAEPAPTRPAEPHGGCAALREPAPGERGGAGPRRPPEGVGLGRGGGGGRGGAGAAGPGPGAAELVAGALRPQALRRRVSSTYLLTKYTPCPPSPRSGPNLARGRAATWAYPGSCNRAGDLPAAPALNQGTAQVCPGVVAQAREGRRWSRTRAQHKGMHDAHMVGEVHRAGG